MNLVFLGPPGAGKGTIAKVAKEALGVPHISTGDLFRANIKNETELGKRVKEILASGGLVPDEITIKMVENRLSESDCEKGYILDGFPRTIPQAEALSKMSNVEGVINFVLSEEEIIKRLSGRRMCPSTGRTYHILFNPPKVEGEMTISRKPSDTALNCIMKLPLHLSTTTRLRMLYWILSAPMTQRRQKITSLLSLRTESKSYAINL